jgi:hypothetical protein
VGVVEGPALVAGRRVLERVGVVAAVVRDRLAGIDRRPEQDEPEDAPGCSAARRIAYPAPIDSPATTTDPVSVASRTARASATNSVSA